APHRLLVAGEARVEQLDGHLAPGEALPSAIHDADAALPEQRADLVLTVEPPTVWGSRRPFHPRSVSCRHRAKLHHRWTPRQCDVMWDTAYKGAIDGMTALRIGCAHVGALSGHHPRRERGPHSPQADACLGASGSGGTAE